MEKELMPDKKNTVLVSGKLEDGIEKTYNWIYEKITTNDPTVEKFIKSDIKITK